MTKLIHLLTHKTGMALIHQKNRIKDAYRERNDDVVIHVCRQRKIGKLAGKWKCNYRLCDWAWPALEIDASAKKRRATA